MILHIVSDDKFIDMAYNMFEKASPNNNEFMVVTNKEKFNYIKTTPITKITRKKFLSKSFAQKLINYELNKSIFINKFFRGTNTIKRRKI